MTDSRLKYLHETDVYQLLCETKNKNISLLSHCKYTSIKCFIKYLDIISNWN